ncbi:hypothetical protein [Actinoallomurus sp. NPDC050550]|uniref:hypothetical protein n=1 Tax=Actinoallomurus sp. NPDC050550 TaxID=3154937 RepID=UPI0033F95DE0
MPVEAPTDAFGEFRRNLDYARKLVEGGRQLGQLKVGAFDVDDLYRAAWVQAVAALGHRRRPSLGPSALSASGATDIVIKALEDRLTAPGREESR